MFNSFKLAPSKKEVASEEAQKYIQTVSDNKSVPEIQTNLMLKKGEKAILEYNRSYLQETRVVRKTSGGGAGFRVAKGVTIGKYSGTSQSHQELKVLDQGTLTITNQRIIFTGPEQTRDVPLSKITRFNMNGKDFEVNASNRKKSMVFSIPGNLMIHNFILEILARGQDPFDLADSY